MKQGTYRGWCDWCGGWVFGNLLCGYHGEKYIFANDPDDDESSGIHPVDPDSVGKYSGFDTPGEYLYGGDICKDQNGYVGIVLYSKASGMWTWIRQDGTEYRLADVFNNLDWYDTLHEGLKTNEADESMLIMVLEDKGILEKNAEGRKE